MRQSWCVLQYRKVQLNSGMTQTKHIVKLLKQEDKIDSSLLLRFLWQHLNPTFTDIDDLHTVDDGFKDKLVEMMACAHDFHSVNSVNQYILRQNSPAYHTFHNYYRRVNEDIESTNHF